MKICKQCGKPTRPRHKVKGLFCSRKCYWEWLKTELSITKKFPQLKDKKWCEEEYKKKSYEQIAKELGCDEGTIYRVFKKHGIKSKSRSERLKGRKFTYEWREKISKSSIKRWEGKKNPNYKGGVTIKNMIARYNKYASRWKKAVKRRALDRCEECGRKKGEKCSCCGLVFPFYVHHKNPFSENPELRYDVNNGLYLCCFCHKKIHSKTAI